MPAFVFTNRSSLYHPNLNRLKTENIAVMKAGAAEQTKNKGIQILNLKSALPQ